MNTDICKLLCPSRIYCFSERQLHTQKKFPVIRLPWSRCSGHKKDNTRFNSFRESEAEASSLGGARKFRPRVGKKSLCCTVSAVGLVILCTKMLLSLMK